jgi:hypothetical protein
MNLLNLMTEPPMLEPCDPDGAVITDNIAVVFELPHSNLPALAAGRIELHPHDDGRWMWATSCQFSHGAGGGYRVGPKWGKFARDRQNALHWAIEELLERMAAEPGDTETARVREWVNTLH